jgi:uncharacterized membrane protein
MKKILLFLSIAILLVLLLPIISAQYIYGDIYINPDGEVEFDVETNSDLNIPELIIENNHLTGITETLTKKENGIWTFSLNPNNEIEYEYIFLDLHLPKNLESIRTTEGVDNILDINEKTITIIENNKQLEFEVTYTLHKEENYTTLYFSIIILLIILIIFILLRKKKSNKSRLDYILPTINDNEKLIIESLMKRNYRQKELRKKLEMPKASFARYMINLEKKKLIVREGEGKNKIIKLK